MSHYDHDIRFPAPVQRPQPKYQDTHRETPQEKNNRPGSTSGRGYSPDSD